MTITQADRDRVIASPYTIFQHDVQRDDLRDPARTHDSVIAVISHMIGLGYFILFTAIRSDHGNDRCLGLHSHANGFAFDHWPNYSADPSDYMTADTHDFRLYLVELSKAVRLYWTPAGPGGEYQIGLAGSADDAADRIAAGSTVFEDDGADHVHCGTQE